LDLFFVRADRAEFTNVKYRQVSLERSRMAEVSVEMGDRSGRKALQSSGQLLVVQRAHPQANSSTEAS
jgi:hypothetical protein